jgi:sporulation protein YlmC with PRC-barrel domain
MRLADLIGSVVVGSDGDEIGDVGDVWLTQDGPPIGVFGAGLRFDKLVIGRFGLASRAGYERPDVQGPVILARLLGRGTKHRPVASWSDIAAIEEGRIRLRLRAGDLERPRSLEQPASGRGWSAGLELLDRQLVDPDGKMAGKVDDLRLELRNDGPPVVTEILAGPGALARRIGGRLGAWIASVHARLHPGSGDPATISFAIVGKIDDQVTLIASREDLATFGAEAWARDHVIAKIPGSSEA